MGKPKGATMSMHLTEPILKVIDKISDKCGISKNHLVRQCIDHSIKYRYAYCSNYLDNPITNRVKQLTEFTDSSKKTKGFYLKSDTIKAIEDISQGVGISKSKVCRHLILYGLVDFVNRNSKELGFD